jgi:hypothetical protein
MKALFGFGLTLGMVLLARQRQEAVRARGGAAAGEDDAQRHIIINLHQDSVAGALVTQPFLVTIGVSADGTLHYNNICKAILDHINLDYEAVDLKIYHEGREVESAEEIKRMIEAESSLHVVLRGRLVERAAGPAAPVVDGAAVEDAAASGAAGSTGSPGQHVARLERQRAGSEVTASASATSL